MVLRIPVCLRLPPPPALQPSQVVAAVGVEYLAGCEVEVARGAGGGYSEEIQVETKTHCCDGCGKNQDDPKQPHQHFRGCGNIEKEKGIKSINWLFHLQNYIQCLI